MKNILILIAGCMSVFLHGQEPESHSHPLVRGLQPHQLVDSYPSRSSGMQDQISTDVDQGMWGELQRSFPYRLVSTEHEFYKLVQSYLTLQKQYEQNKNTLNVVQNQVTELETITPAPLRIRLLRSLKKMITSACTLVVTAGLAQKIGNTRELLPLKTGASTVGVGLSAYFFIKGIGAIQQNELNELPQLKQKLETLQNSVTTTKLYLNHFDQLLKKHTIFHQTHPTPATSGEYQGLLGSTPLPDDSN